MQICTRRMVTEAFAGESQGRDEKAVLFWGNYFLAALQKKKNLFFFCLLNLHLHGFFFFCSTPQLFQTSTSDLAGVLSIWIPHQPWWFMPNAPLNTSPVLNLYQNQVSFRFGLGLPYGLSYRLLLQGSCWQRPNCTSRDPVPIGHFLWQARALELLIQAETQSTHLLVVGWDLKS